MINLWGHLHSCLGFNKSQNLDQNKKKDKMLEVAENNATLFFIISP